MKKLLLILFLPLFILADDQTPPKVNFTFQKVQIYDHSYIFIYLHETLQFKLLHDLSCPCLKITKQKMKDVCDYVTNKSKFSNVLDKYEDD